MDTKPPATAGHQETAVVWSFPSELFIRTSFQEGDSMDPFIEKTTRSPSIRERLALLALNGALFQLLYGACQVAAAKAGVTRTIETAWDSAVPFVPWMLVPYMTLAPLLCLAFLIARDGQTLRALSQRCMTATAIGSLIFALWPLRETASAPLSTTPVLAILGEALKRLDGPYNQWPSLHVAYCVIVWPALRDALGHAPVRIAVFAWLVLVAASTVLTHQHYLPDLIGGAVLGLLAVRFVPSRRPQASVSLHYAIVASAAITLALTVLPLLLGVWVAMCCSGVALAYARNDNDFLRKREGKFPIRIWMFYAPYLAGYWATWKFVRWRERGRAPFRRIAERVWIGRRLDCDEATALPANCAVIDLASELTATKSLRTRVTRTLAMLDLIRPTAGDLAAVCDAIDAALATGREVYVHCSMGYLRSAEVGRAWSVRQSRRSAP